LGRGPFNFKSRGSYKLAIYVAGLFLNPAPASRENSWCAEKAGNSTPNRCLKTGREFQMTALSVGFDKNGFSTVFSFADGRFREFKSVDDIECAGGLNITRHKESARGDIRVSMADVLLGWYKIDDKVVKRRDWGDDIVVGKYRVLYPVYDPASISQRKGDFPVIIHKREKILLILSKCMASNFLRGRINPEESLKRRVISVFGITHPEGGEEEAEIAVFYEDEFKELAATFALKFILSKKRRFDIPDDWCKNPSKKFWNACGICYIGMRNGVDSAFFWDEHRRVKERTVFPFPIKFNTEESLQDLINNGCTGNVALGPKMILTKNKTIVAVPTNHDEAFIITKGVEENFVALMTGDKNALKRVVEENGFIYSNGWITIKG
jgi:hypothetical protein